MCVGSVSGPGRVNCARRRPERESRFCCGLFESHRILVTAFEGTFQTHFPPTLPHNMPDFDFLADYSEAEILALCGFTAAVLRLLYEKYCGKGTPIGRPIYLWWLLQFYKMYPISRGLRSIHMGRLRSRRCFMTRLYKWEVNDLQQ